MQRLLPPHLVGLLLIAMATTALLFDGPTIFGSSLRWIGALPGAAGLALNLSGARLFERTGTNIRTFDEPEIFVESGAFRWTRNPMYLGFLVVLLGVAAMLDSWVTMLGPTAFFLAANQWYIPFEERRLRATFGDTYEAYCGRVRRWL